MAKNTNARFLYESVERSDNNYARTRILIYIVCVCGRSHSFEKDLIFRFEHQNDEIIIKIREYNILICIVNILFF